MLAWQRVPHVRHPNWLAPSPERIVFLVRQYGDAVRRANVRSERKAAKELLTMIMGRKPTKEQINKAIPD